MPRSFKQLLKDGALSQQRSPEITANFSLGHLLGRQVLSTLAQIFDHSMVSINSSTPALQAPSPLPKTPSFALRIQCFQQFRGICFSLEVSPEGAITWSFGTGRLPSLLGEPRSDRKIETRIVEALLRSYVS